MKRGIEALFRAITKVEELCLAWGMLAIAGLTIANVVGRTFGESFAFAEELCQFLIVLLTFLGVGYATSKGRHVRMTAIYDALPVRARKALMLVITASTALLLFGLTWLAVRYALGTVRELGTRSPVLRVPLWIVYASAPIGLMLAGIQYSLAFVRNCFDSAVWLSFEHRDDEDVAPAAEI